MFILLNIFLNLNVLFLAFQYHKKLFCFNPSPPMSFAMHCSISKKIFFLYEPVYSVNYDYQKQLIQNCQSVEEADYLIMSTNNYFPGRSCSTYRDIFKVYPKNVIFSKKVILIAEEDIVMMKEYFNFKFHDNITAVLGHNDEKILQEYFKINNCFTHLTFAQYFPDHNTSYDEFIKRPYIIQSAISNANFHVNSNRDKYLYQSIQHFGLNKTANYGRLFHNADFVGNSWQGKLPPNAFFCFAMENSISDYWITEKLFFAYRNDAIPIYRGSIQNQKILSDYGINNKAYIDASNMTTYELVNYIDRLVKSDQKKELYEMYKQPLIPDKYFFENKIITNYKKLITHLETNPNSNFSLISIK